MVTPNRKDPEEFAMSWMDKLWEAATGSQSVFFVIEMMRTHGFEERLIRLAETLRAEELGQRQLFTVSDQLPPPPEDARALSQLFHLDVLGYFRDNFTFDRTTRFLGQMMREIRAVC